MVVIEVRTPQEIVDNLAKLRDRCPAELGEAFWRFANLVMNDSARICPVDTGFLRGSRYVNHPSMYEGEINLNMGYSAEYAFWVHELPKYHKAPTQYKFLEQPLEQAAPDMVEEIVRITMGILTEGR